MAIFGDDDGQLICTRDRKNSLRKKKNPRNGFAFDGEKIILSRNLRNDNKKLLANYSITINVYKNNRFKFGCTKDKLTKK